MFVHCCHCTECQRQTGSAFAVNAIIETRRIELLAGTVTERSLPTESGRGIDLVQCAACHTGLWTHYAGAGRVFAFVRTGTLDDPSACPPDIHIYTRSKQPWVVLPESVPAVPGYYRTADLWPEDSLARRAAAKAAATGET
ncbi:GFA family protein [Parasphingopyxis algicola]|nr:GFA family protein [Parasphingopyxis algicola]